MKYSLRSLMIGLTLLCVALGGVMGRVEYLQRMTAFHLNETFRCLYAKHSDVRDAIPDAIAAMQHGELAQRYHKAASNPWEFVDTTPVAVANFDAQFLAEDIVTGNVARHFLPDDDLTSEQRAFYALVAESRQAYIRDHMPTSSAPAINPAKP